MFFLCERSSLRSNALELGWHPNLVLAGLSGLQRIDDVSDDTKEPTNPSYICRTINKTLKKTHSHNWGRSEVEVLANIQEWKPSEYADGDPEPNPLQSGKV